MIDRVGLNVCVTDRRMRIDVRVLVKTRILALSLSGPEIRSPRTELGGNISV